MKSKYNSYISISQAIFAAALYGMSAPLSKLLLLKIPPLMLSTLLYLGAGIGMLIIDSVKRIFKIQPVEARLEKKELPYVILMILLDIAAPVLLLFGLTMTTSSNASLLNNFEIVATSIIARLVFKEAIGNRVWLSITLITISSIILSIRDLSNFSFSIGSVFVLLACVCWGFENNCTRNLSLKDPLQVVIIKGLGSGFGALIIAVLADEIAWNASYVLLSLLLGFFAYGLSIFFYVTAQRTLGAARTSAYYAIAPFIGVGISFIAFSEPLTIPYIIATVVMLAGTYFAVVEMHEHEHRHVLIAHTHRHNHADYHHNHTHHSTVHGEHSHSHIHDESIHIHKHTPDLHHIHEH
jgi:drug/metabolite transporter (DMT)-like permease